MRNKLKKIYEKIKETLIDDENVLKKIGVNMRKKKKKKNEKRKKKKKKI